MLTHQTRAGSQRPEGLMEFAVPRRGGADDESAIGDGFREAVVLLRAGKYG